MTMDKEIKVSKSKKKQAIELISRIAKEFESILITVDGDWTKVIEPLRNIIEKNLGDNEFLVLNRLDGQALVHSNRLREGLFVTTAELGVVRSPQPIAQIYHRDTGEVLLDAISPISINGKHMYAVRMGIPIHKSRFSNTFVIGAVPTMILGGAWIVSSLSPIAIVFSMMSLLLWTIYSYFVHRKILLSLEESFKVTKSVTRGDLRATAIARSRDELGTLAFEVNKLNRGIKSIITDMDSVSQKTQEITKTQAVHTKALAESYEYLAALFQEFSAGSIEQIEGMKEAQVQVNEMKAASQCIRQSIQEVQSLALSAKQTSQEGLQAVSDVIQEMEIISESTKQSNDSIKKLEEQASKIGEIVSLINGISTQTNLLALNAAIEAARAGEHGRGFAVVAEEVRKLADDSAQSAVQIMELIVKVQEMVRVAVENMEKGINKIENGKLVINKAGGAIHLLDQVIINTGHKVQENLINTEKLQTQSETLANVQNNATSIASQFSSAAQQAASTMDQQMKAVEEVATMARLLSDTTLQLDNVIKRFTW